MPRISDYLDLHPFDAELESKPADRDSVLSLISHSVKKLIDERKSQKRYTDGVQFPIRALGANYSLSSIGLARGGAAIQTEGLNMHLSRPWPSTEDATGISSARLRDARDRRIPFAFLRGQSSKARAYVHIEAGIQIRDLLKDLQGCGLALPTMGSGGRQTVGGAISTATHGGDFILPPNQSTLGDSVRAIHLIDPDGRQWWITRPDSEFSGIERLLVQMEDACTKTVRAAYQQELFKRELERGKAPSSQVKEARNVLAQKQSEAAEARVADFSIRSYFRDVNDASMEYFLDAARTSVGRLGIIYAMILEVVPQYTLIEINQEEEWSAVKGSLAAVSNFTNGIFSCALNERTFINAQRQAARKAEDVPNFVSSVLASNGRQPLRHLNIAINLANPEQCWVTRRWKAMGNLPPIGIEIEESPPSEIGPILLPFASRPLELLKDTNQWLQIIKSMDLIPEDKLDDVKDLLNQVLEMILDPKREDFALSLGCAKNLAICFGIVTLPLKKRTLLDVCAIVIELINKNLPRKLPLEGERLGAFAFLLIHNILKNPKSAALLKRLEKYLPEIEEAISKQNTKESRKYPKSVKVYEKMRSYNWLKRAIQTLSKDLTIEQTTKFLTSLLLRMEYSKRVRVGPATSILDTHNYNQDGFFSANSAEFSFDANDKRYLSFIGTVIELAGGKKDYYPVFGYIGIRFMRKASALLAMQQFDYTVSVEVTQLRAATRDVYEKFRNDVYDAALDLKAYGRCFPHWGQECHFAKTKWEELYGDKFYGDKLAKWKIVRRGLDPSSKFKTDFTRDCGLED